jgi:DNA polymerase-3 subunit gamma/tau
MDNFIVSARKYRPNDFSSVVGQDALVKTLKNAIAINHLAHAYLFCGPRGVGKTTCARIFAKTINCFNPTANHEACNQCESCVSFNEQRSYNIQELDAASNNGTDDIKYLIEQVRIPPQIGKYRVYIIDEVHMLSSAAFNAFLKTLEEPPAHAIFILATTEKHKIIPTILSRCQIYDFNRITVADTVKHLQYVAQNEGVTVDLNALNVIAQKSDGGMRDALSIFDQLVSFCGNNITYQGVIDNLNVLDYEYYFRIVDCFLKGDYTGSLLIFNEILNRGFDAQHFITGLSSHLRDVLVSKDPSTVKLLEVGADIASRYIQQAALCPQEFIFEALKIANDCDLNYRLSKNKRLLVELSLIRMCQLTNEKKKLTDSLNIPLQQIQAVQTSDTKQPSVTSTKVMNHNSDGATNITSVKPEITTPNTSKPNLQIQASAASANGQAFTARPQGISIKKTGNTNILSTTVESPEINYQHLKNDFTHDEFLSKWKSFTNLIPEELRIINFIQSNEPVLNKDYSFEVNVSNVMLQNDLKSVERQLLGFLRKELQNSAISMKINMVEAPEKMRNLTPEEIYRQMVQENSALEILKKNLNLELD